MNKDMTIIIGGVADIRGAEEYAIFTEDAYGDFVQGKDIRPFIAVFKSYLEHKGINQDLINLCIRFPDEIDPRLAFVEIPVENIKEVYNANTKT